MKLFSRDYCLVIGILLCSIIELGIFSFWRGRYDYKITSIVFLLSGILVGALFLIFFYKKKWKENNSISSISTIKKILVLVVILVGSWICYNALSPHIYLNPIDDFYSATGSDVIPSMGIIVDRFLDGKFPYYTIKEWAFSHQLFPTYLPTFWGAFIIPDILGIDYRLWAYIIWLIVILLYHRLIISSQLHIGITLFLAALPYVFLYNISSHDNEGMFIFSVELLIVAYYILLGFSLTSNSTMFKGAALVLCLLSRYSVVLILPLFVVILLLQKQRSELLKVITITAIGILVLYVPFLIRDYTILQQGLEHYNKATLGTWTPTHWEVGQERPGFLFKGIGFGWIGFENFSGELIDKVSLYKKLHLFLSLFTVMILTWIYWKVKNKIDHRIYSIGALKIYLVVFTHFIQMPFPYLFMVPIFFSLLLIGFSFSQMKIP